MYRIAAREDLSETTFQLDVEHPMLAQAAQPGQFVLVMSHEHGERIPLTIADYDRERGLITLVIQAVGKTTYEMQETLEEGDELFAMVGPMGIPSHIRDHEKVVCVGGGLGVAPVYPQLKAYKQSDAYVIGVIGFRTRELIFWRERFKQSCDELHVCTDDGSVGIKGFVTTGLERVLEVHSDIDEVIAIGPPIMMKAVAELTRPHHIRTTVSLNPIMVDGTGMCGGCRVIVDGKMKFGCVDGPDFDGHKVDFDDLLSRLNRFKEEEALAVERYREKCRQHDRAPSA